eukprot:scaffold40908_cov75-Phaeocystis_antarctica.AAC.1
MLTFEVGKYANTKRPTYILVDRGTASAAEVLAAALRMHRMRTAHLHAHAHAHVMRMLWVQVFAAALQENRAAKVVGEQTYGEPSGRLHATCPLLPFRCTCTLSLLCSLPSLCAPQARGSCSPSRSSPTAQRSCSPSPSTARRAATTSTARASLPTSLSPARLAPTPSRVWTPRSRRGDCRSCTEPGKNEKARVD